MGRKLTPTDIAHEVAKRMHWRGICPSRPAPNGMTWADYLLPKVGEEPCPGHDLSWYYKPPERRTIGYEIARKALEMSLTDEDKERILRGERFYCKGGVHEIYAKPHESERFKEVVKEILGYVPDARTLMLIGLFWLADWPDCPYCGRKAEEK